MGGKPSKGKKKGATSLVEVPQQAPYIVPAPKAGAQLLLYYRVIGAEAPRPVEVNLDAVVGHLVHEIARLEHILDGGARSRMVVSYQGTPLTDLKQPLADTGLSSQSTVEFVHNPAPKRQHIRIDRIDSTKATDAWNPTGDKITLEARPNRILIKCDRWEDQGWGNAKSAVSLQTVSPLDGSTNVYDRHKGVWGTFRSSGRHQPGPSEKTFERNNAWLQELHPGSTLQVVFRVGGGGGHSISVEKLVVDVE
eukprot:Hpha_TRINITY_DN6975_c0_g1::TRINITY_DN6975_c0_g1_i1::g.139581::m.139581